MEEFLLFGLCFILVLVMYEIFLVTPLKKKHNPDKELIEIKYLVIRYHLDLDKISYKQLLQICALTSSLDIAITVSLVVLVNGLLLELLVGFGAILILIGGSYHLIYLFYKKKGMIKDGKHK